MSKPEKVLFVINQLSGGGAERILSILCNEIVNRDIEVYLCYTGKNNSAISYWVDKRVKEVYCYGKYTPKGYDGWFYCQYKLRATVKKIKPDIVVSFKMGASLTTLQSCKGLDIPVVMAVRGIAENVKPYIREALQVYLDKLTGIVYLSEEQRQDYHQLFNMSESIKEVVIVNPVEFTPLWDKPRINVNKEIISVGRLHPQKNFSMLINAFSKIADEYSDWKLTIYGKGALRDELQKQIDRLNLTKRVFLPGFVSNIEEKYHEASIFVMSSKYEAFGNVLLEALCMGIPCISTDCYGGCAPKEIIEVGVNGLIVDNDNQEALAVAMKKLIEDPAYAIQLGENAKSIRNKFELSHIVDRWIEYLSYCMKS